MAQQRYYTAQWDLRSMSGRRDENGNPVEYKLSRTAHGEMQCSCPVWKFNRKWLHNGRLIPKDERDYYTGPINGHCKHIVFILENRNIEEDDVQMQQTQTPIEIIVTEGPDGRLRGLVEDLPEWKNRSKEA